MEDVFILNVSVILLSGFIAGCVCKYFKISPLIGYLLVGALIGPGGLDLTGAKALQKEIESEKQLLKLREKFSSPFDDAAESEASFSTSPEEPLVADAGVDAGADAEAVADVEVADVAADADARVDAEIKAQEAEREWERQEERLEELVAEAHESKRAIDAVTEFGCLLLLFSIGIEFTFDKLAATARYMFVGGLLQMLLTIAGTFAVCMAFQMEWQAALAIGCVVALSSTALVYRSMTDLGVADTKRAQATLGLLIFQDIALVPLLLILPRILGVGEVSDANLWIANPWIDMVLKSLVFCGIVLLLKYANIRVIISRLANLQANDMVILYAIVVLVVMCLAAMLLGLTPALAAGITLGENRLTHQIDALVLPFRETFSAIFFISLGMLTDFSHVVQHPILCLVVLAAAISFKALCATLALRACCMDFRGSLAYGTSIAQIGELAFMLLSMASGVIDPMVYNTILFVSVASLVLTPNMVKIALTKFGMKPEEKKSTGKDEALAPELRRAIAEAKGQVIIVIGAGHIGKRVADELGTLGALVCLVDFNPVNLHPFKQNGVATVVGDGADQNVLRAAGIDHSGAVFVTVPRDDLALNVVRSAHDMFPALPIVARVRYNLNVSALKRAGAIRVFCEEEHIAEELVQVLQEAAKYAKVSHADAGA